MGSSVSNSALKASSLRDGLSIVVITLNEEKNLPSLLKDIPKEALLVVVDSGSTDKTVEIAQAFGATIKTRAFDNYAAQKNYALSLATTTWVLCLDADERPNQALWNSVLAAVAENSPHDSAYCLSRQLVFLGRKMKYGRTKDQLTRLFKPSLAAYTNEIHETLQVQNNGPIHALKGILWHHSYDNLDDYFARFNRYTTLIAAARSKRNIKAPHPLMLALRFPADFFVRYVVKLGFLDGWQGFLWALFGSFYGFVKYAKLVELDHIRHSRK